MHEVGEWIESSIIDVGHYYCPSTVGFVLLPMKGIESTLITTDELCVLVPSGHHLCAQMAVTPRELREEGFIMEKTQCALHTTPHSKG